MFVLLLTKVICFNVYRINSLQMAKKIGKFDFVLESLFVTDSHNYAHLSENVPLRDLYMDYWQPVKLKF